MVSFTNVPPLDWQSPIVDPQSGRPSAQFIRLWQNTFQNAEGNAAAAEEAIALVNAMADKMIIAGVALDGGGRLGDPGDLTIDHADSPVTPGTYGSATKIPVIEVDQQGHVTDVTEEDVQSLPAGGTTGQVLAKASGTDYDVEWVDQTGGGGGSGALVKLGQVVLASDQASISFSNLPQNFDDLVIVVQAMSPNTGSGNSLRAQINGDTGSNYDWYGQTRFGNSGLQYAQNSLWFDDIPPHATSGVTEGTKTCTIQIMNYSSTAVQKFCHTEGQLRYVNSGGYSPDQSWTLTVGNWRNTAAVTDLLFYGDGGNLMAGTTITVYGRGGVGTSAPSIIARYWRQRLLAHNPTNAHADDGYGLCLVDWKNSSGSLLSGYTASASNTDTGGGWSIANAFNGSSASFNGWYSGGNTLNSSPWLAIDFGAAVMPTQLCFAPLTGFTWTIGTQIAVEYSTDGEIWYTLCVIKNRAGVDNVQETYTIQ